MADDAIHGIVPHDVNCEICKLFTQKLGTDTGSANYLPKKPTLKDVFAAASAGDMISWSIYDPPTLTTHLSWHPGPDPAEHPLDWQPLCWSVSKPAVLPSSGYAINPSIGAVNCFECKQLYESGDFVGHLSPRTVADHEAGL